MHEHSSAGQPAGIEFNIKAERDLDVGAVAFAHCHYREDLNRVRKIFCVDMFNVHAAVGEAAAQSGNMLISGRFFLIKDQVFHGSIQEIIRILGLCFFHR